MIELAVREVIKDNVKIAAFGSYSVPKKCSCQKVMNSDNCTFLCRKGSAYYTYPLHLNNTQMIQKDLNSH